MRRTALLIALLFAAACSPAESGDITTSQASSTTVVETTTTSAQTTTTDSNGFPVVVTDANGEVTIEDEPRRIVSLSSTATEMLFAMDAGDQVVAVDEFSVYPGEAPITELSGFTPDLEAIVEYEPDLVVISYDPGELVSGLSVVGVTSLLLSTAASLDDSYAQIELLGEATGHAGEAEDLISEMQIGIDRILAATVVPPGISFYHEIEPTLYSASSSSFLGQVYALLGMENIADEADPDGFGFPQLASEYVVSSDPDLIFLADSSMGVTPDSLAERPGWAEMTAVQGGAVAILDEYLASNWGPRVVELLQSIADAVTTLAPVT
ncbi:MAG TPA: ABC transporter substrate-binding protein [Acidimicrobiia bacterium]|nr:ABC transporter substrate-binding protein [Acidimicrobiia bacterium]